MAKPNGVEEDGGKVIESGLLSVPRLEECARCSALKASLVRA